MLKDFIAKLPIDVIRKVELEDDLVKIPTEIDVNEFYKKHKENIESDTLTQEKAIYLAAINKPKARMSIPKLLVKGR